MSSVKRTNPLDANCPVWVGEGETPISCTEKIKVLNENYLELRQILIDALEDGVLMGCDEQRLRQELAALVRSVQLDVTA